MVSFYCFISYLMSKIHWSVGAHKNSQLLFALPFPADAREFRDREDSIYLLIPRYPISPAPIRIIK